jgi:SAM-dependent methyltransferase
VTERDQAAARARVLTAARPGAATMELGDDRRSTLSAGLARATFRAAAGALPIRTGALDHAIAVGVLAADDRPAAFREIQRALREGGSFVFGAADLDGAFAKEHLALREMGMVAAPMDTIPELAHVPWRLCVAFKPLTRSQAAAERGHETH